MICFVVTRLASSCRCCRVGTGKLRRCPLPSQPMPAPGWGVSTLLTDTAPAGSVHKYFAVPYPQLASPSWQSSQSIHLTIPFCKYSVPLCTIFMDGGETPIQNFLSCNLLKISAYAKAFHICLPPASFKAGSHALEGTE